MSTVYNVYANNGTGGPIDWTTIIATVTGLTWLSPAIPVSSDQSYGIRAYDNVLLLEEKGLSAIVRIVTDASGNDITNTPPSPTGLSASATSGGGAQARWVFTKGKPATTPTGFKVWLTLGTSVNFASAPALTVPYVAKGPLSAFAATLTGLADATVYAVGVRAYNATGTETNTNQVLVTGDSTAPLPPDSLTASATISPDP